MNKMRFVYAALAVALLLTVPAAGQDDDRTVVRWFVGIGTGDLPEQREAQRAVVDAFNASQDEILLQLQIVQADIARDQLLRQIEAGSPPDIVGPIGLGGSNEFPGQFLDLQPLVDASGYDLSRYPESLVDVYRVEGEGLVGIPFATFPSFIYYNRELFDAAGLPYPPQVNGVPYVDADGNEQPWNTETLAQLAMALTLDEDGNSATSPAFDENSIVQFGFAPQWLDLRGTLTMFGGASVVDSDGNAQLPEAWRDGLAWYYDGLWNDYFIPNDVYQSSEQIDYDPFGSRRVAMAHTHLWYICCVGEGDDWDIAVMPAHDGEPTAALQADTFRILKDSPNPEAAFEVVAYLVGEASLDLLLVYGGIPARVEDRGPFFERLDDQFPHDVNWSVIDESLSIPDIPSHESEMPNHSMSEDRIEDFHTLLYDRPFDLDAELVALLTDLEAIFAGESLTEE